MGECQGWLFEPTFNRSIKLRQADHRISDNAGALLLREIDHRLALTADLAAELADPRRPDRIRYQQVELLRQHLYGLALGHVHQDDHDLLAHDPAMRLDVWNRPGPAVLDERLASQPSNWRLVDRLSTRPHRRALRQALATRANVPVTLRRHKFLSRLVIRRGMSFRWPRAAADGGDIYEARTQPSASEARIRGEAALHSADESRRAEELGCRQRERLPSRLACQDVLVGPMPRGGVRAQLQVQLVEGDALWVLAAERGVGVGETRRPGHLVRPSQDSIRIANLRPKCKGQP